MTDPIQPSAAAVAVPWYRQRRILAAVAVLAVVVAVIAVAGGGGGDDQVAGPSPSDRTSTTLTGDPGSTDEAEEPDESDGADDESPAATTTSKAPASETTEPPTATTSPPPTTTTTAPPGFTDEDGAEPTTALPPGPQGPVQSSACSPTGPPKIPSSVVDGESSDGKRWRTVGSLEGNCGATSGPFQTTGIDTRIVVRSDADQFIAFIEDVNDPGSNGGYADVVCRTRCSDDQVLVNRAGTYRLRVQATDGPWVAQIQEYR